LYYTFHVVGRSVRIVIEDFVWDEEIEEHFARHWLSQDDVLAVAKSDFLGFENLPDRGGTHVMIGPDEAGRILYVSIRPTSTSGLWEPVTGWESRLGRRIWAKERGGAG
jgi:hypothetical protein